MNDVQPHRYDYFIFINKLMMSKIDVQCLVTLNHPLSDEHISN